MIRRFDARLAVRPLCRARGGARGPRPILTWATAWQPHISGIFFDEVSTSPADRWCLEDYRDLAVAQPMLDRVVTNHGVMPPSGFFGAPVSDTAVAFEGAYGSWLAYTASLPPGASAAEAAVLVHGVPTAAAMRQVIDLAVARGYGSVYATDKLFGFGLNPWEGLPAYWDEELAHVQRWNDGPAAVACDDFSPGAAVTCTAGPVVPGTAVHFAVGPAGSTCLPALPDCLDIGSVNYLGSVVAGSGGMASRSFTVPATVPVGFTVRVQAVVLGANGEVHPYFEGTVLP